MSELPVAVITGASSGIGAATAIAAHDSDLDDTPASVDSPVIKDDQAMESSSRSKGLVSASNVGEGVGDTAGSRKVLLCCC